MHLELNDAAAERPPAFNGGDLPPSNVNDFQDLKCYFDIVDGKCELSASICWFLCLRNGDGAVPTERLK